MVMKSVDEAPVSFASTSLEIATDSSVASLVSVSTTAELEPILPKPSVTPATIEFVPIFGNVTLAEKVSSAWTIAVPSVVPLSVKVTVWPTTAAAPPEVTVPVIVWLATSLVSAALVMVTAGAMLSSVSTTAVLVPILPKLSVTVATIVSGGPWFGSVTLTEKLPSACTVALPNVVPLSVKVTVWLIDGISAAGITWCR